MARGAILCAAALACAGCTASHTFLGGDSTTDTLVDTLADTAHDTAHDTAVDTPPDLPPTCPEPDPPPDGPLPYWDLDGSIWPFADDVHLSCRVEAVSEEDEGSYVVEMSCAVPGGLEGHTLHMQAHPRMWLFLETGARVRLHYVADPIWWVNRWFSLRYDGGGLIAAGVDAEYLYPDGDPAWYDPLRVSLVEGLCPPGDDWCGSIERQGLAVTLGDTGTILYDRSYATIGLLETVQLYVGETHSYVEMMCDDVPMTWVSALFVAIPEG
jgi:hypothetical protein